MEKIPIQDEIKDLVEKHLDNQLSVADRARFIELLQEETNRSIISNIIEEIFYQHRYQDSSGLNKQQLFEQVIHEAAEREGSSKPLFVPSAPSHNIKRWISYAAAVVVIVVMGISYLMDRHPAHKPAGKVVAYTPSPVVPAKNQVMLTRADGSRVVLDDKNGPNLPAKNEDNIAAVGNDRIVYKAQAVPGSAPSYNTITTPHGGQYHIVLPDNSEVWLNATSSLQFPVAFAGNERRVVLTGEGYFEVAKDTSHPFVVQVNDIRVNVLGTHFNIMAYQDEEAVKTTLLEGSVKLVSNHANAILKPGQQGNLVQGDNKFSLTTANIEQVMAWKNGEFRFVDTRPETIMRQVARWYDLSVSYEGDLTDIALSGIISRKENVSELLAILEATHRVKFKMDGNRVIVMPY